MKELITPFHCCTSISVGMSNDYSYFISPRMSIKHFSIKEQVNMVMMMKKEGVGA